AIINDLLDFSKIEAGKMEIIPGKYLLLSLVNDSVSIIRPWLIEKPLRFYTNIDSRLPNELIGDEVRLRQILLNLLSNAVKYTPRGHISVTITATPNEDTTVGTDLINLRIAVSDTGAGIQAEDQPKLFGEFVQVDTKKNRSIEGTGLGLAITKRLCLAMGGDITMESEYGRGSTFTAIIPQGIASTVPFAVADNPEEKKVLVYEGRRSGAESLCWSLKSLGVPYTLVTEEAAFAEALGQVWDFIFSGYGLYEKIKPHISGNTVPLVLMMEWGNETSVSGVHFLPLPVHSLSIAEILNGKDLDNEGNVAPGGFSGVRFTAPAARLLVVDDIATNLKVAEGLMSPYQMMVETCLRGEEAVKMVKSRRYDLIFMDHMMPGMDGIEVTALIRSWEAEQKTPKEIPIIALTANAVSGMKEMFLSEGFNDYLSKPIDVSELDELLAKWLPADLKHRPELTHRATPREKAEAVPVIPGVDVAKGIAMTGGTVAGYKTILSIFRKDAEERLPLLRRLAGQDSIATQDRGVFVTQVHALKSVSASIGATGISAEAAGLEAAGKTGDMATIWKSLPGFIERLAELVDAINTVDAEYLSNREALAIGEQDSQTAVDQTMPLFNELAEALKNMKTSDIDRLLEKLKSLAVDSKIRAALDSISDHVLMFEFDKALEIVEALVKQSIHGGF
ncbi:MAG: response regulator, partial [Treponema sp.]|nr:response regulator [Treponema sp.]